MEIAYWAGLTARFGTERTVLTQYQSACAESSKAYFSSFKDNVLPLVSIRSPETVRAAYREFYKRRCVARCTFRGDRPPLLSDADSVYGPQDGVDAYLGRIGISLDVHVPVVTASSSRVAAPAPAPAPQRLLAAGPPPGPTTAPAPAKRAIVAVGLVDDDGPPSKKAKTTL